MLRTRFFNKLAISMLVASVSFFNNLSTEKKNYSHYLLDHGFQEDNGSRRNTCQGININHGFQDIFTRWKRSTLEGIHVDDLDKGREIWL
jgi:hypothetical protein